MYNQSPEPHNGYDQPQYGQQYERQFSEQQYEQQSSYRQGYQGYEQQNYERPGYGQYEQPQYNQPQYNQAAPQQAWQYAYPVMAPQKDWLTTFLLCLFLGPLGIHRFYSGHIAIGLIQFFTGGGFGIWWLIDLILIATDNYTDNYGRPLRR